MKLLNWLRNKRIEYLKSKVEEMNLKADYKEAKNRFIKQRLEMKCKYAEVKKLNAEARLQNIKTFERINSNIKNIPFNSIPRLPRLRI